MGGLFLFCFSGGRQSFVKDIGARLGPEMEGKVKHDWMIRVLEDLQRYADGHGMLALAEHLDQARLLALTEAASLPDEPADAGECNLMAFD